jgi:cation diffusion facilitator CzcD-associated flavoprotein CzcO
MTVRQSSCDPSAVLRDHVPPAAYRAGDEGNGGVAAADVGVAILGAGFAGICMAIKLRESGRNDFAIFEKAATLGGTWRDNTYPGCSCDVPSHLYSFSFDPNPDWSRTYASQPEILAYLESVAARHRITSRISFRTEIVECIWDEDASRWHLRAADGRRYTARVVVAAVGALQTPVEPPLPGVEQFAGARFHSARWRHDVDLHGKDVAVIGTGASGVQFIPEIAPLVRRLTVYQRTPSWVLPRNDRRVSRLRRLLYARVPGLLQLRRAWQFCKAEAVAIGLVHWPRLMGRGQKRSVRYRKRVISDWLLYSRLHPHYTLGCKRVLLSDDFYATMKLPHVELVTVPIQEVRARSILAADGGDRACDVLISATGFRPFDASTCVTVIGRGGRSLADDWRQGPEAYRGVAVAGYPNYFLLVGPNSGLGHTSIVFIIEAQVRYVLQCLAWLEQGRLREVEVRPDVQQAYNVTLQARFAGTVWRQTPGKPWQRPCRSWYAPGGKNIALWPGLAIRYWWAMRRAEIVDYTPVPKTRTQSPMRAGSSTSMANEAGNNSR